MHILTVELLNQIDYITNIYNCFLNDLGQPQVSQLTHRPVLFKEFVFC